MHCQCIACTRSSDMGSESAGGQKLECFNAKQIIFYECFENQVNALSF